MAKKKPDGGYEFTERENDVFRGLVRYMAFVQWALLILGVLSCLGGVLILSKSAFPGVAAVVTGVIHLTVAAFTFRAIASFRQIVETRGEDIDYLLDALASLKNVYVVQACGFVVQVVLGSIALARGGA